MGQTVNGLHHLWVHSSSRGTDPIFQLQSLNKQRLVVDNQERAGDIGEYKQKSMIDQSATYNVVLYDYYQGQISILLLLRFVC